MSGRLRVAPIVEGHGEQNCVRLLLERVGYERLGLSYVDVQRPLRHPKGGLSAPGSAVLRSAVEMSARRLIAAAAADPQPCVGLILVLLDADDDCAATLGPRLRDATRAVRPDIPSAAVLAVKEYETWCVASADSLAGVVTLAPGERAPADPEGGGLGKAWIQKRFDGTRYTEPVDQPRLTKRLDLQVVHDRCPSFRKLCRDLRAAAEAVVSAGDSLPTDARNPP